MSPDAAPNQTKLTTTLPALGAAVAGDQALGKVKEDGTVAAATFAPEANITGATATKRTFTLVNKGQDGNGTTVIATLDFTTGTNANDFDEIAFTLTGTVADRNVSAGDILAVVEAITSTGTANPGGLVEVLIDRR
jgi:hypothetical protein